MDGVQIPANSEIEFPAPHLLSPNGEACQHFLLSRYGQRSPRELIVNHLSDPEQIVAILTAANQYKVKVTLPKRGVACKLLQLCELNYDYRIANENLSPVAGRRSPVDFNGGNRQ